ncbi:MAG: alpha/beta hydrolase family protein [Chthoniobacterales bacterium]
MFNQTLEKDMAVLKKLHEGDIHFQSSSADENKWIIFYDSPTNPATYLYDRKSQKANLLHTSHDSFSLEELSPMDPVTFFAHDKLLIHGYLTLPKKSAAKNLPTILMVHGGP